MSSIRMEELMEEMRYQAQDQAQAQDHHHLGKGKANGKETSSSHDLDLELVETRYQSSAEYDGSDEEIEIAFEGNLSDLEDFDGRQNESMEGYYVPKTNQMSQKNVPKTPNVPKSVTFGRPENFLDGTETSQLPLTRRTTNNKLNISENDFVHPVPPVVSSTPVQMSQMSQFQTENVPNYCHLVPIFDSKKSFGVSSGELYTNNVPKPFHFVHRTKAVSGSPPYLGHQGISFNKCPIIPKYNVLFNSYTRSVYHHSDKIYTPEFLSSICHQVQKTPQIIGQEELSRVLHSVGPHEFFRQTTNCPLPYANVIHTNVVFPNASTPTVPLTHQLLNGKTDNLYICPETQQLGTVETSRVFITPLIKGLENPLFAIHKLRQKLASLEETDDESAEEEMLVRQRIRRGDCIQKKDIFAWLRFWEK